MNQLEYKENGLPINGFAIELGPDGNKAALAIRDLFVTHYPEIKDVTNLQYNGASSNFCYFVSTDNRANYGFNHEILNKVYKVYKYREFKELFLNGKNEPKGKQRDIFPIF